MFPEAWQLQDYQIMSRNKFEYILSNLDIGETRKVPNERNPDFEVIDLKVKLQPIISYFNMRNVLLKIPDFKTPMSIDESLRVKVLKFIKKYTVNKALFCIFKAKKCQHKV